MKRLYPSNLLILLILSAGMTFSANAQTVQYNQSFTSGVTASSQCTAWTSFCGSLLSSYIYTGFNISGSLNTTGYTCTNPTVATAVASALRSGSTTTQTSDGHTWYVGTGCGSGCSGGGGAVIELAVDQGTCACGSVASVRPAINNLNWGGMGTTCSAPSQTLIVTFYYQSITYTGGSPRTIANACQNSGPISINSLLTTADPATGLTATWTVNSAPAHGTLAGFPVTAPTGASVTPPGSLTYTPTAGFSGIDSFNIKASDGSANAFCTIIVTVNPTPSGITGTECVVVGGVTQQLSDFTPGGVWSSGSPAIATVSPTGVVTGLSAGTASISYAPPGSICPAVATVTVSTLPAAIGGTTNVCIGNTTALSEAGTGLWSSSNPAVGSISTTGVVAGLSGGTTNITYTLPSTCIAVAPVVVNIAPTAIIGSLTTCASGGTTALSDGITGGTWTSGSTAIATVGAGSGIVTGVGTGVASITYTAPTGCITSSPVTVNPLPAVIGGTTSVCAGSTITLTDAVSGGLWTSSNTSQATIGIGTGIVSGVSAGTPTITYTLGSTGCRITTSVIVNPLPGAITGGSSICVGGSFTLSDAGGGTWTSSNLSAATINTFTGVLTGVGPGITTITYSLSTGCFATSSVLVNPLPTAYTVTGGGTYCAGGTGVHIGLTYASTGVNYVLLLAGSPVSIATPGSNSGLDFGMYTTSGVYTVLATNAGTLCATNMTGSVTVSVNPLPSMHNITGGGGYCAGGAGSPLGTDGSDMGINYQLYNGAAPVGPVFAGSGLPLSFGSYTAAGTYTVVATNALTGCSQLMGSSAIITVSAVPTTFSVTGGGSYCAGGIGQPIGTSESDPGTTYQVFHGGLPVGPSVPSSGGPLNFGLFTAAGTYTVIATNPGGCTANMSGSATIIINPLPAINTVTGGGAYCAGGAGEHVGLSFSTIGISYTLFYTGGAVTTVLGSGSGLDFGAQTVPGVYTVQATNVATGCISNMFGSAIITINSLPNGSIDVLGGGPYCTGSVGPDIYTDGSEGGVNYQLFNGTAPTGSAHGGTGSGIDFGNFTASGIYTVEATNAVTGCSIFLTGSVTVSTTPLPPLHTITSSGSSYCAGGTGVDIMLNGSNSGITYNLILAGSVINTVAGTGSPLDFGLQTAPGVYTITATNTTTTCTQNMLGSITVTINPVPAVDTVTGGGSYCAGGTGFLVGLNSSTPGITYQLFNTGSPSGIPLSGSGSSISYGYKTAGGNYTVTATNLLTGCTSTMYGSAIINVNPLPTIDTLSGGGNYCTSDSGRSIILNNSDLGVNYQLYRSGVAIGAPLAGITAPLSFGLETTGVYTAKATDATTGCTSNMIGSIHVNTIAPTAYTVTGGGSYCVGGTGVLINLSGSTPGLRYQLVTSGSSPVGSPLTGTGLPLSYGLITIAGTYNVIATDTLLGCVGSMAGSALVVVNSLPVAETVTGGGSFCAGAGGEHVGLAGSVTGVNYQLEVAGVITGSPVPGSTGTSLDFGLQTTAGAYTVIAADATTGCGNTMTGSVSISILPTPAPYAVTIDNSGNYCAGDTGVHIGLINSQTGVNYHLYRGSTPVGTTVAGTGSALTLGLETVAGTYTVVAVNPSTSCTSNMAGSVLVNIVPLPDVHSVTGGGSFCPGGSGVPVGLDGSTVGTSYELYNGTSPVVSTYGTGTSLSFGLQNTTGIYTVIATSAITPCENNMYGSANVVYDTLPVPHIVLISYPGNGVGVTQVDSIKALVSNGGPDPVYQWYVNGEAIAGATNSTFSGQLFFSGDSVSCSVMSSGPCGGLTATKSLTISLLGVGVKQVIGSAADIRLQPNPNNGAFSLKGTLGNNTNEELSIEITNMLGQVVYTGSMKAVNGSIDQKINLSNVANGMYLLNLGSGTQRSIFHFVIEQ